MSSLRCVAGLEWMLSDLSCGNDVEDELELGLEEPVVNPGTTSGTNLSVLHRILCHFGLAWFSNAGMLVLTGTKLSVLHRILCHFWQAWFPNAGMLVLRRRTVAGLDEES